MSITQVKIFISDLKSGMYVARLDRPWLETPYKVQGFLIKLEKDIERLQKLVSEGRIIVAGPNPAIDSDDPGPAGFTGSLVIAEFVSSRTLHQGLTFIA